MKNKIYNPTKIYTFDYNEDVKDERWIQKSLALKNRAQWTCQRCGAIGNVVVHHPYYLDGLHLWDYPDTVLKVYCTKCHSIEHNSDIDPKDIVTKAIKKGVSKGDIIDCLEELIAEKSTPMPSGVIIAAQNASKTTEDLNQLSENHKQDTSIPKEKKGIIYIPYSLATCGFTASELQLKLIIAILKQLKSQLRQMQCNYFLGTSETQTLFTFYPEKQTELEIFIHLNELGIKSNNYKETLDTLLNNNSYVYIPATKENSYGDNTAIYKNIEKLDSNENTINNRHIYGNTNKNFIKIIIERHVADYIFNDKKGIYSLSEKAFGKLKGKYTKRLYMYLSVFRKNKSGYHEIDFWTFRNRIGFEDFIVENSVIQKEYNSTLNKLVYPLFSEFKKRVLEPARKAVEELAQNNEIDFTFTYEPIKHSYRSKNPKAIRFNFNLKNK